MTDFVAVLTNMQKEISLTSWRRRSWPRGVYIRSHQQSDSRSPFPYVVVLVMGDTRAPWEPSPEDLWAQDWVALGKDVTCCSTKP